MSPADSFKYPELDISTQPSFSASTRRRPLERPSTGAPASQASTASSGLSSTVNSVVANNTHRSLLSKTDSLMSDPAEAAGAASQQWSFISSASNPGGLAQAWDRESSQQSRSYYSDVDEEELEEESACGSQASASGVANVNKDLGLKESQVLSELQTSVSHLRHRHGKTEDHMSVSNDQAIKIPEPPQSGVAAPPRTIKKWLYRLIQVALFALLFLSFAPLLSDRFADTKEEQQEVSPAAADVVELCPEPPIAAASPDLSNEDLTSAPVEAEPVPSLLSPRFDDERQDDSQDASPDQEHDSLEEDVPDEMSRDDEPAPPEPAGPPAEHITHRESSKHPNTQAEHPLKPFIHISLAALSSVLALLPGLILWRRRQILKASAAHKAEKERLAEVQAMAASKEIWANPGSQGRAVRQYEAEEELLVKKEEDSTEKLTSSTSTIKQEPDEVVHEFNLCFIGAPLSGITSILSRQLFDRYPASSDSATEAERTQRFHKRDTCVQITLNDTLPSPARRRTRNAAAVDPVSRLPPLASQPNTHFVMVADLTDPKSTNAAQLESIRQALVKQYPGRLIFVLGNKLDEALSAVSDQVDDWATEQNLPYSEISALTGEGVSDALRDIVHDIRSTL